VLWWEFTSFAGEKRLTNLHVRVHVYQHSYDKAHVLLLLISFFLYYEQPPCIYSENLISSVWPAT